MDWRSYPKIPSMGHSSLMGMASITDGEVVVEEKVDGSQVSFGKLDGELQIWSKKRKINIADPDGMFARAVVEICNRAEKLDEGWIYRGEYLQRPRHNALAYDRVPVGHIILFDIEIGDGLTLAGETKKTEAERIGFEVVPTIFCGQVESAEQMKGFLDRESILGGQKIEGVVVKNYARSGRSGGTLMCKYVSDGFKEVHTKKKVKPSDLPRDVIALISAKYRTSARWGKALQRLRESGELTGTPKDIGALCRSTVLDVAEECPDEIKDELYLWAWPYIKRNITQGLAGWYKEQLLDKEFD